MAYRDVDAAMRCRLDMAYMAGHETGEQNLLQCLGKQDEAKHDHESAVNAEMRCRLDMAYEDRHAVKLGLKATQAQHGVQRCSDAVQA